MTINSKTKNKFPTLLDLMFNNRQAIKRQKNNDFFAKTKPQMFYKSKKHE